MSGIAYGGATYSTQNDEGAAPNIDLEALAAEFAAGQEEFEAKGGGAETKAGSATQGGPNTDKHEALEPKGSGSYIVVLDPRDTALFEKTVNDEEALIQSLFGESKVNQALKFGCSQKCPCSEGQELARYFYFRRVYSYTH